MTQATKYAITPALLLIVCGCTKPTIARPPTTASVPSKPSRELLVMDVREDAAEGAADTTLQWKPRTGTCSISIIAKSLADPTLRHIDILDEQDHPIGVLDFAARQDNQWLVAGSTVKTNHELHVRLPHALVGDVVSAMVTEEVGEADWASVKRIGAGECVLVETAPGKLASPMVRALGQSVELKWAASPGAAPASIRLDGDANEIGHETMDEFEGHIKGKNSGSIQFTPAGKASKRLFSLTFS